MLLSVIRGLKIPLPLFRPISGILPIYRTSDYLFLVIQTWTLPFLMRKLGYIKMFTKALSDPGLPNTMVLGG